MARQTLYEYEVVWTGNFPIDMLRYDNAYPLRETDSVEIHKSLDRLSRAKGPFTARIQSTIAGPTIGRWESFGASVRNVTTRTV